MSEKKTKTTYSSLTGFHRAVPIILGASAAFVALCFITKDSGALGHAISAVLTGLFSWGAYAIPALIALHAIFYPADLGRRSILSRCIFSVITVVTLAALAHTVGYWNSDAVAFDLGEFYRQGQSAVGGGFIGGLVGFGLAKIFGRVGMVIIAAAIFATYVSYFFSGGHKGLSKAFYTIVKGIVFFGDFVERKIKSAIAGAKKSKAERKRKASEEKNRELMEDEFFDVDNGIEHLEIPGLGICETRAPESVESAPTLHDKVHHKSAATAEDAAEMERRRRAREAEYARGEAVRTETPKAESARRTVDYDFIIEDITDRRSEESVTDTPVIDASRRAEAGSSTDSSADSIFTAEFDPFRLATSDKLANKRSSRSLLDEKPSVTESISELTEEDVERARRTAEFEKRRAAIIAGRRVEAVPVTNAGEFTGTPKNVEVHTAQAQAVEAVSEEQSVSVTIDKPINEPSPEARYDAKPVTDMRYEAQPATEARGAEEARPPFEERSRIPTEDSRPTAPEGESTGAPRVERTVYTSKDTYRRAAGFAAATFDEGKQTTYTARPTETPRTAAQPYASAQARDDSRTVSAYAPQTVMSESVYEASSSVADARRDGGYAEADYGYAARAEEPRTERLDFSRGYETDVFEPKYSAHVETGSYSTDDSSRGEPAPEFKDYEVPSDNGNTGLLFEFEAGGDKAADPEPKVLVTETTVFGAEDEAKYDGAEEPEDDEAELSDAELDEAQSEDGEWSDEEIAPENQNPLVSEMRDMFPALRDEEESDGDGYETEQAYAEECEAEQAEEYSSDAVSEEYDEDGDYADDEDAPPFDMPTVAEKRTEPKAAEKPIEKPKPDYSNYQFPPIDLLGLEKPQDDEAIYAEIRENTNIIIETLASFNVVASIKGVDRGPRITRYEVVPARGVKVNQITHLFDDITLNLAADGVRMEAPIPGKSAIGFEIPNKNPANVRLRELLECEEFINAKSNTFVCIGKDVAGNPVFGDIGKFPHALVAGATGMGKSVCINSIMISMLYKARPDQVKFIMIDPKKVEFRMYSGIPHLLIPVITEAKQAAGALMWAVEEMERRYDLIEKLNIRTIDAYNERREKDPSIGDHMPKIVIVIDELNDLMMQVRDPVEDLIMRIAQKARAAGIHLIIGTQRPDVKVITGTIKANINTRMSCKVTSVVDSRTILEMAGAEKLLNKGDMLFKPVDKTKPIRVQGAFVSDSEVEAIMDFLKSEEVGAQYDEEIFAEINKAAQKCGNKKGGGAVEDDGMDDDDVCGYYNDQKFLDAVELAIRSRKISTSLLQRKLSIGYGKAAKYIDAMEEIGVVSEPNGQKPRDVLITMDEWLEKLSRVDV